MIGFIGTSLQLQSITTAHNQWLFTTRSIPYWATSCLLFHFDKWRTTVHCSHIEFKSVFSDWLLSNDSFVAIRCSGNVIPEPLLSNGLPLWLHYFGFQAVLTEQLRSNGLFRHSIILQLDAPDSHVIYPTKDEIMPDRKELKIY
jgi:hypothetical protein